MLVLCILIVECLFLTIPQVCLQFVIVVFPDHTHYYLSFIYFFYTRDDFNFGIVNFLLLNGDFPRSPYDGIYISQLIRFVRVCSNVGDCKNRTYFQLLRVIKKVIDTINFVKLFLNVITYSLS